MGIENVKLVNFDITEIDGSKQIELAELGGVKFHLKYADYFTPMLLKKG